MIPFAIDAGKRTCASLVKGVDKKMNNTGGITNRSLSEETVLVTEVDIIPIVITHRSIGK